jgi:hypothetical protein
MSHAGSKIAAVARADVGRSLWTGDLPNGHLGCASSVSRVLREAGAANVRELSVNGLDHALQNRGWQKDSFENRRPGDVIIVNGGSRHGHTGIVGDNPNVTYNNHSGSGRWSQDGADYWHRRSRGQDLHVLHAPGGSDSSPPAGHDQHAEKTSFPDHGQGDRSDRSAQIGRGTHQTAAGLDKLMSEYTMPNGQHLTAAQRAGILGNFQKESNFNTASYNPHERAIGLAQWEGGRRGQLESYAHQHGGAVTDPRIQVGFMMHELATSERKALAHLQAAHTPQEAAHAFQHYYERSKSLSNRPEMAARIYAELHGNGA